MTINLQTNGVPVAATDANKRQIADDLKRATPAPITVSTLLVRATHANIDIEIASATAVNIDVPDPTTCVIGDEFRGINNGAGAVTLRTHLGGALTGNALLPATVSQYDGWLVRYTSAGFRRLA